MSNADPLVWEEYNQGEWRMMELMEELTQARETLWHTVEGVPSDLLAKKNQAGWSMLHVLEHLYLAETLTAEAIRKALAKPAATEPIAVKNIQPTLDRTNKLQAPEALLPKGIFHSLDEAKQALAKSRATIQSIIAANDVKTLRCHTSEHGLYGTLNLEQRLQLIGLHERRHIAQIEEMKTLLK